MGKKARLKKKQRRELLDKEKANSLVERKVKNILKKTVIFILFISVLTLGIALRIYHLSTVATRTPDEGTYAAQAVKILQKGWGGVRELVDFHHSHRTEWIHPPPTRVGYLIPLAIVMGIMDERDVEVGAYLSCFFSIVTLTLLIITGLRFFNRWITLYALLFLSVSPVDLAIARRTWQDAFLGCIGFFLLYVCCEIIKGAHRKIWYILFVVSGSYCMLIKESGAVFYALCTAWIFLVFLSKEKSFLRAFLFIAVSALGVGISGALLSYAAGGISNYARVLMHIKEAVPENSYAVLYQSGPWYHFFGAFWRVSPGNAVLCLLGIVGMFLSGNLRSETKRLPDKNRTAIFGIIFFIIGLVTIIAIMPYVQNFRYVSVVYGPFYLISGLGLWSLIQRLRTKLYKFPFLILTVCIVAAIIIGAISDYKEFVKVYVRGGTQDLSIWSVRSYLRMLRP